MYRRLVLLIITIALTVGLIAWYRSQTMAAPQGHSAAAYQKKHVQERARTGPGDESRGLADQVEAGARRAAEDGNYACCIQPACSWCLLHGGRCTCAIGVGSGRGACRECHGGWEAGQGRIPGRSKQDVRNMKTFGLDRGSERRSEGTGATVPLPAAATTPGAASAHAPDGEKLFAENNCLSCHKMDGKGGAVGPVLTHEAQRHADVTWHIEHLKNPAKVSPGSTMPSYAKLTSDELNALASYLAARK